MEKHTPKPQNPCFSSGPCAKRPGWSIDQLDTSLMGRSHRSGPGKAMLKALIESHKSILGIPEDYVVGIVPASDTGAFEMAMWSMLGARGVDVFAWEEFSATWLKDVTNELKLENANTYEADFGALPDLAQAKPENDIIFVWNGTTSGVRVPNADWIADDREGLTFCDATSAVFAYDLPWEKLDVTTWSWQKCLGSEAAHGMLVLSPRAVERLENFTPDRPLPKIFRLLKAGKLNQGIFVGETINTPSMLAAADCMDALKWVESVGGLKTTIARPLESFAHLEQWVEQTEWIDFLSEDPQTRSVTSVQFKITAPWFQDMDTDAQWSAVSALCKILEDEGVAYDIKAHRKSLPGIRIWCGATVEPNDVKSLIPWLNWAYEQVRAENQAKAA